MLYQMMRINKSTAPLEKIKSNGKIIWQQQKLVHLKIWIILRLNGLGAVCLKLWDFRRYQWKHRSFLSHSLMDDLSQIKAKSVTLPQSQINVLVICGEHRALRFIITSAGPTSPTLQSPLISRFSSSSRPKVRKKSYHQNMGNQRASTLTWLMKSVCVLVLVSYHNSVLAWEILEIRSLVLTQVWTLSDLSGHFCHKTSSLSLDLQFSLYICTIKITVLTK